MYLIIDSGSTKSDWVLLDQNNSQTFFTTIGFNPLFQSEEIIVDAILANEGLKNCSISIDEVFYYGAGCSSASLISLVENALKKVFIHAVITVKSDLAACAYATYQGRPAISCILGTGSNSCYFDGVNISEVLPALGYILGDEGSGSYFGKKLLANYLYGKLPANIVKDFESNYEIDKNIIFENVYKKPNANVYLASFTKFIANHSDDSFIKQLVYEGMKKFIEIHVCCYENHKTTDVHFIGSIAFVFKNELQKAANELEITIGQIIQKPIDGLVNYHLETILKSKNG